MKICLRCKEQYPSSFTSQICKNESCSGSVVDVENDILDTIFTLYEKGYITFDSSSGNTIGGDIYITFMQNISEKNIEPLPIGFTSEFLDDDQMVCIKYSVSTTSVSQIQKLEELMKSRIELLKWAEKLPVIEWWEIRFQDLDKNNINILVDKYNEIVKSNPPITIQFIDFDNFENGFSLTGKANDLKLIKKDITAFGKSKGYRYKLYNWK